MPGKAIKGKHGMQDNELNHLDGQANINQASLQALGTMDPERFTFVFGKSCMFTYEKLQTLGLVAAHT